MARGLFRSRKHHYCLFFCHLALEKMLKAIVVAKTNDHAPWTHNLPFLAGRAEIAFSKDDMDFLTEMTRWNLEGRYPTDVTALKKAATGSLAKVYLRKTKGFLK